jgi:O-6-methylguanine DNA methyltransferase
LRWLRIVPNPHALLQIVGRASAWTRSSSRRAGHAAFVARNDPNFSWLAGRIGRQAAVRAVGGASSRNPIALIIPCHRIVGADGALVGYAGGVERKRWLLGHERTALAPQQGS